MRIFGYRAYGGPEVLEFLEVDDPTPGPGQVLVRVRATTVNPADLKTRSGLRVGTVPVEFPMAFGREASGTVIAVGEGVTHVAPGDEVFGSSAAGQGSFGELALLDATGTVLRPAAVAPEVAAAIPVAFGTAVDALDHLALSPGATLLVVGAGGGVGLAACELAAGDGVRVLGVASAGKGPLVNSRGGVHVASGAGWAGVVRALAPDGVDAVLDCVGGDVLLEASALRHPGGGLVSLAAPQRASDLGAAVLQRRRTADVFSRVAGLITGRRLTPHLGRVLPFEDAALAVALVEDGHAAGKVVVTLP